MYQPTEIIAKLQVAKTAGAISENDLISRKGLCELFLYRKVSMASIAADGSEEKIGEDFYVGDLHPHYKKDNMLVSLKIFSPDQLMAQNQSCNVFVAKKLGAEILEEETAKYHLPWNNEKHITYSTEHMGVLKYDYATDKQSEHIFPYLVQYNESFYDLLKRTTNRWGEFMYYEDGRLNVGYDQKQKPLDPGSWTAFEYCDLTLPITAHSIEEDIDLEGVDDPNIVSTPLKKSPDELRNLPVCDLEHGLDIWLMKKIESTLSRTGSIPEYVGEQLFDEAYGYAVALRNKKTVDDEFNETYFKEMEVEEQYDMAEFDGEEREAFNQFTELNTPYTREKYAAVLDAEQRAGQNAIVIDYDTTYPGLKLGQIIKFMNEEYIVVEVDCTTQQIEKQSADKSQSLFNLTNKVEIVSQLHFSVTVTAKSENGRFYPILLPTGHIRTSAPQLATVFDANDPLNQNRVRVLFPWQHLKPETDEEREEAAKVASPWLVYATSAASKSNGIFGKHYVGDNVIVNFANGNVENPYVVGGLSLKGNKVPGSLIEKDIVLSSPGGHTLRIDDGSGAGLTAFLAGIVFPGYEMLTTFFPKLSGSDGDLMKIWGAEEGISKQFEGGFLLTDKYGVYTVSGSTDGRNVSVKSPWGDVAINAFTGITISAPNGDIEIKGKNITIEAGNNQELVSGANIERKLMADKKDTPLGTVGSNVGELTAAVAKKLAEQVHFLDMSYIRALAELLKRPVEGALTVKSNRYLKMEAGKGECNYPKDAYKSRAARELKEENEEKLNKGLRLKQAMLELVEKTGALAAEVDRRYKQKYNRCVDLNISDGGFKKTIAEAAKLASDYSSAGNNTTICKSFEDLKDRMWKMPYAALTEANLGFKDNYGSGGAGDVTDDAVVVYRANYPIAGNAMTDDQVKEQIVKLRTQKKNQILKAANKLHKAISELQNLRSLNGRDINKVVGRFWFTDVPDKYKESLKNAFDKEKLKEGANDLIYYKPAEGDAALLTDKYGEADLANYKKGLARKAAVLLIEGLGFKNEWRSEGPRPFTVEAVTTGDGWKNYVESIKSVPKLTPLKSEGRKIFEEGAKGVIDWENLKGTYDTMKGFFGGNAEINSWGNAENGGILFSNGESTFSLGDTITPVQGFVDEKLDYAEQNDNPVKDFIDKLRAELMKL